ncbi:MAG: hypothetical protein NPIRA03_36610 [Nitrospirales bacterium]|nr:MAG: hypothetical protein NPIRA03_36610 [Nitrospirales bacterium]
MKHILLALVALLFMYNMVWSARNPIPHQWTKMAMDDVDPSPYQWDGPCGVVSEILEAGFVLCSAPLRVPIPESDISGTNAPWMFQPLYGL